MVCMSCPPVSIPHPLPRPKRVGIQIPPASYSPAPPSLLPTLLTNPLHLIPSVTWLGHLDGPVLWLAIYLLLILSCLALSLSCQNKKDNLLLFLYVWPSYNRLILNIYAPYSESMYCFYPIFIFECMYRIGWGKINDFDFDFLIWYPEPGIWIGSGRPINYPRVSTGSGTYLDILWPLEKIFCQIGRKSLNFYKILIFVRIFLWIFDNAVRIRIQEAN